MHLPAENELTAPNSPNVLWSISGCYGRSLTMLLYSVHQCLVHLITDELKPGIVAEGTLSMKDKAICPLQWRHNGRDSVSNHQSHDYLLNHLFRRSSKKTSKLCVTGLCAGNSPGTGEFPAQMASNAENVSIWWRHHANGITIFAWKYVFIPTFVAHLCTCIIDNVLKTAEHRHFIRL